MVARRRIIFAALGLAIVSACSLVTNLDDLARDGGVDAELPDTTQVDAGTDSSSVEAGDADANTGPVIDGSYAFSGDWASASTTGTGAASIAPIPSGGYVIGGDYTGMNVTFGAYALPAAKGQRDAYVVTLDAKGNPTGALGFGSTTADEVTAVTADAAGFVYVTGLMGSAGTLNGTSLAAGSFVAKLSAANLSAAPVWTHSFALTIACATCLTVNGTTLTLGVSFFNTLTYDTSKSVTSNGGFDMLLVEYATADGTSQWAGQIGGTGDDIVEGVARDATNALYVVGDYTSPSLMSGQALGTMVPTGPGTMQNVLVAKLAASHSPIYANAYGDPGGTTILGAGIAPDNAGRVAVGANFFGGVNFGLGVTGASASNGIVFVIDEMQNKTIWQQPIAPAFNGLSGIAVDPWGHVLATGIYITGVMIGSTTLTTTTGSEGSYLAKFGPPPTYASEWVAQFPEILDSGPTVGSSMVTVASNGTAVVSGALSGVTNLGNGQFTAGSPQDSFVAGRVP